MLQAEWQARPITERGLLAEVLRHDGAMSDSTGADSSARRLSHVSTGTRASAISMDPASLANALNMPPDLALAGLRGGATGALYAPLQLHLPRRKRAQLLLLQREEAALRDAFNVKFAAVKKLKQDTLDKVAERGARVAEIQRGLDLQVAPQVPQPDACEDIDALLEVTDGEVSVPKWTSEEERCAAHLSSVCTAGSVSLGLAHTCLCWAIAGLRRHCVQGAPAGGSGAG